MVNVTAAEAETTLENISVLLGNSSLNCFSAKLNRSIIPMIANLVSSKVIVYAREDIHNQTIFIGMFYELPHRNRNQSRQLLSPWTLERT